MKTKQPCKHRVVDLSYLHAMSDAQRRMKRKEKQLKCPVCLKWIWETEYLPPPSARRIVTVRHG